MKRFFAALISIIMLLSAIPSMANERFIKITQLAANNLTGDVTISGKLEGYSYSYWGGEQLVTITVVKKGATPEQAQADNDKLFHLAELNVSTAGEFTYTFTHKMKQTVDECVVWVNSSGYEKATGSYSLYVQGSQDEILESANVAIVGSPLYYINGLVREAEKLPYEEDGSFFIPAKMAAELTGAEYNDKENNFKLNESTFEEEYIETETLKNAGISIFEYPESGILYFGAEITKTQAESLVPMFGIHVSNTGDDNDTGTVNNPVSSINRALEIYHTAIDNKYIFVHEGVYEEIINIDSSFSDLNLIGIGDVRISAPSMKIDASEFNPVEDAAALSELDTKISNSVLWASAPGCNEEMPSFAGTNTSPTGKIESFYKVFQNGEEAGIARYPNGGGFTVARALVPDDGDYTHESVYYDDVKKLEKWGQSKTIRAMTFRAAGYTVSDKTILSTDVENKIIRFSNKSGVKQYQDIGKRFFIYDALCELDAPGEWYIDRDKERIYYYPRENFNGIEIVSDVSDLITIDGAKNIRLENFEISRSRKNGVTVKDADNVKIIDCEVKDIGRYGIRTINCTNSTIDGCDVHNIENGGIYLNYTTDIDEGLVTQNNIARNCTVYNIGLKNLIASAIYIGGTGNTVSHNTIFNVPNMGVFFYGNDNIIEYNDFYNCLKYCDDMGIIYGNPGIMGFGNIIRYNHLHHFESLNTNPQELYMIYLDADTSGTLMQGNLIDLTNQPKNASFGLAGGGRNNVLKENIFLGSAEPLEGKLAASCFYMSNRYNVYANQWLHQNIVDSLPVYKFINKLTQEQKNLWFTKYPGLEDEYGYYAAYVKALEEYNNDPENVAKPKSGTIGVARECYVIYNIVGNTEYYNYTNKVRTYEEDMQRTYGRYDSGNDAKAERYVIEDSIGNEFYEHFTPPANFPAYSAGTTKEKGLSGKELKIRYPENGSTVSGGEVRLFWDKDLSAGEYTAKVYDADTNILIHQDKTIESFMDVSLPDGRYRFELSAQDYDDDVVLTDVSEFECSESDISIITSLDLFENNTRLAVGDTGTISVYATNSEDERKSVVGEDGLKLTSSNEEVLIIEQSGSYTAKAKGIAVVTAEYKGISKKMVIFVTDTVYDELTADNLSDYAGASQISAIENPVGTKQAMALKSANEQDISSYASVADVSSYFMSAWIYDEGINVNTPRFGVWLDSSVKVRFGAESAARTTYKLLLNSAGTIGSRIVDTEIDRTNGWHQVFAEFVYDENETAVSGDTQIKGVTTISFYFDGVLASKIKSSKKIYPKYLETGKNIKFLDRFVAKYYKSPKFVSEEQKLEAIENIQSASPEKAEEVFSESREYLELDYTEFDTLTHKSIVYAMLAAASDCKSSEEFSLLFNECTVIVKALENNDYNKVNENENKWGIGSLSVYQDYSGFSDEERKAINDKILESGFNSINGFATLFKTVMAETLLKNTLSAIKAAEAQSSADYTLLYTLLSERADAYGIDFSEYTALSEPKKLKTMKLLCNALYENEALTTGIIQGELDLIAATVKNETEVIKIDISDNRTMFSKVGFQTSTETLQPDDMKGTIKVMAFYDNNTSADITGDPSITYTSSDNNLVRIFPDGTYKINGSGMAIITVKCGYAEKSMVFYATAEAPYRRNLIPPASGSIIAADDPVYGEGKAMKIYDNNYHQISEVTSTTPKEYTAGVWVYDHGIEKNSPYFGMGKSGSQIIMYGAEEASSKYYTLAKTSTPSGTISDEVKIPREVGWHHIFAKVSYASVKTTTEFYFDGVYVGKAVTSSANAPKYLHTGKNQEFKERYIAVYYADNVTDPLDKLERDYQYTTRDNKTKLSVSLISNDESKVTKAKLIFVCKNSFGVITNVKIYPLEIAPLGKAAESIEAETGTTIEAFIWDGVSTMTPLFDKIDSQD